MKKNQLQLPALFLILLCFLFLTACGTAAVDQNNEAAETSQKTPTQSETENPAEESTTTLEDLLGEDYVNYLTETIMMQMGNRMEKDPNVRYFPIEDNAPLSNYVTIDETTKFDVDEEGNPVIYFPAGTVTDEENGEQSFIIPKLYSSSEQAAG